MIFLKNKNILFSLAISFYIFCLVFGLKIINIALILVILFSLFDFKEYQLILKSYFKENKEILFVMILLIVYQIIRAFVGDDLGDKRIGFLFLMFLSSIALLKTKNLKFILNSFLLSLVCLILFGSWNIYQYYLEADEFNMKSGGHIDPMLIVARPYLGFLLNIGFLLCFYFFNSIKSKMKWIYFFIAILCIGYMFFIAIRIQILSLIFVFLIFLTFYLKVSILKKIGALLFLFIAVCSLFFINPTLKDRFEITSFEKGHVIQNLSYKEPRVIIWNCALNITKEDSFNQFFGIGNIKKIDSKLEDCYYKINTENPIRDYFLSALFNTHNQFLEYYVVSGLVGVSLLIGLMLSIGYKIRKYFIPMGLLIILINFLIVENLFDRQIGSYFFGFTFYLIIAISSDIKKEQKKLYKST